MRGVIERIDQEAAGAEAGEALKAARMLVYDEEQLEWVACRLSLRVTALACAIAGRGEGRGRTELALGETEVVEEEMEVQKADGGYGDTEKKMVSVVRDKGAEVSIEVLPDHARRSKHSRLATFSVTAGGKTLLLAAAGHAEMWEWARAVRRRGQPEGAGAEQAAALLGAAMYKKCCNEEGTKAEVEETKGLLQRRPRHDTHSGYSPG